MSTILGWWRRRKCKRINRYCVTHDVSAWDARDIRSRCSTFADHQEPRK